MSAWAITAHAHARSTDAAVLSGYLGRKNTFDNAMIEFADLYANQGGRDYELLKAAVKRGRVKAAKGSQSAIKLATKKALISAREALE